MKNTGRIYDSAGNPIGSDDDIHDANLPHGVQALIEARVNSAIADIREHNRDDLKDLARDQTRKWRHLVYILGAISLISAIINVITIFIAPEKVIKWISLQIDKKLTEPMIRESADRLIDHNIIKCWE